MTVFVLVVVLTLPVAVMVVVGPWLVTVTVVLGGLSVDVATGTEARGWGVADGVPLPPEAPMARPASRPPTPVTQGLRNSPAERARLGERGLGCWGPAYGGGADDGAAGKGVPPG